MDGYRKTDERIRAAIRAARVARGWSQPDLAARMNRSTQSVYLWERGRVPRRANAEELIELLDLAPDIAAKLRAVASW